MHEQAASFVLDALDERERAEFERHLLVCTDCAAELEPFRRTAAALAFAGPLPVPPDPLRLRVLDLPRAVVVPLPRRRTRPRLVAIAAVAAACAAVFASVRATGGDHGFVPSLTAHGARGASGALLVSDAGDAVLFARGLPPLARGTVYELWIVQDGRALAAGFLRGRVGVLTRPLATGATVAVSLEPAGGSRRPTGPLLLRTETA